eukprot:1151789-Pelagomonas_calceolata.AAC.1
MESAHNAREADWQELSARWMQFEQELTSDNERCLTPVRVGAGCWVYLPVCWLLLYVFFFKHDTCTTTEFTRAGKRGSLY